MRIKKAITKNIPTILSLWVCAFLAISCSSIDAADNNDFEADIRSVIEIQLDAFARGDSTTAYAQASPTIQALFPTKSIFMLMVRSGYAALISPRKVDFLELFDDQGSPVYRVGVESLDGKRWVAFYTMAAQPDNSWRIAGCVLILTAGRSV